MNEGKKRVVIAVGPGRGLRGVVISVQPMKIHGSRTHVRTDDGSDFWFQDYQKDALFAEESAEGKAIRKEFEESLGTPDLQVDVAFAKQVVEGDQTFEVRKAIERIVRHPGDEALSALLDLIAYQLDSGTMSAKPPGWIPPSLTALINHRVHPDVGPLVSRRLRTWWEDPAKQRLCGFVANALCSIPKPDHRIVEVLRELCRRAAAPELIMARLKAGDEEVYSDLAKVRVVERDGILHLDAGDLTPDTADRLVEKMGDGAANLRQLSLVRQGRAAFGGVNLDAWMSWPGLKRFQRLDLSAGFVGKKGLMAVIESRFLSDELEYLDISSCDVGQAGCTVLAKAKALAPLRELNIDAGDYDRSRFSFASLERLFPKKGCVLTSLEILWIRGWDVTSTMLSNLAGSGRTHALRRVFLTDGVVELQRSEGVRG